MIVGYFVDKQTPKICKIFEWLDIIHEKINFCVITMHLLVALHSPKIILK